MDAFSPRGLNTFLLRRVRPALEGTVFKHFDFRFQPEFAAPASILDAWGNVRLAKELQLRIGKFKGPIGLERLQSPSDMMFIERRLPTNLVPNRDIGAQLHGDLFEGILSYQVGIFNGVVDGASADIDNNDYKDVNGRVFLKPLLPLGSDLFSGFGIGIAASHGTRTPRRVRFREIAGGNLFREVAQLLTEKLVIGWFQGRTAKAERTTRAGPSAGTSSHRAAGCR